MKMKDIQLKAKTALTKDVFEFSFSKPEGFEYEAGQFVQFYVPHEESTVKRSYSLCSVRTDENLQFCIKLEEGGIASNYFAKLEIGDVAQISEPLGRFTCNEPEADLFFIATGVGISPVFGMIRDVLENKQGSQSIHLLFGLRQAKNIFWKKELETLQANYDNFSFRMCLSGQEQTVDCLSGRVTDHLEDIDITSHLYICGSPQMVQDTRKLLLDKGVSKDRLHFEIF